MCMASLSCWAQRRHCSLSQLVHQVPATCRLPLPCCGPSAGGSDFVLPGLMDLDNPHVADPLPGLARPWAPRGGSSAAGFGVPEPAVASPRKGSRSAPQLSQQQREEEPQAPPLPPWPQDAQGEQQEGGQAAPGGPVPLVPVPVPRPGSGGSSAAVASSSAPDGGAWEEGAPQPLGQASAPAAAGPRRSSLSRAAGTSPPTGRAFSKSVSFPDSVASQPPPPASPRGGSTAALETASEGTRAAAQPDQVPTAGAGAGAVPAPAEPQANSVPSSSEPAAVPLSAPLVTGEHPRNEAATADSLVQPAAGAEAETAGECADAGWGFGSLMMTGEEVEEGSQAAGGAQPPPAETAAGPLQQAAAGAGSGHFVGKGSGSSRSGSLDSSVVPSEQVRQQAGAGGAWALRQGSVSSVQWAQEKYMQHMAAPCVLELLSCLLKRCALNAWPLAPSAPLQGTAGTPTGQSGGSKLMTRGLQYLRQHSQQARQAQQQQPAMQEGAASSVLAPGGAEEGADGGRPRESIKAQGRRMAGLMLSRMNQAGKAFAQQVQQARQQHQQGGSGGGGAGPNRAHMD